MAGSALFEIRFLLLDESWHGFDSETLWATCTGIDTYTLDSIPFFVKGISLGDVIVAYEAGGILIYSQVKAKSGNSTYRISLFDKNLLAEGMQFLEELRESGLRVEKAPVNFPFFAVNVPLSYNIDRFYAKLEVLEEAGVLAFEEGDFGRPKH